jgi:hypothetical protein
MTPRKPEFLLNSVLHLIMIFMCLITRKVTSIIVINNSLIKHVCNYKLKFQVRNLKYATKHDSTLYKLLPSLDFTIFLRNFSNTVLKQTPALNIILLFFTSKYAFRYLVLIWLHFVQSNSRTKT